ncbi:MAG: beta-galactosidase, partial [Kiritimatiellia bacterium]|nr:beta-galactosidase [Kiritimatiellia bacterium]
ARPPVELKVYTPSMAVKTPAFAFMKPSARGKPLKVFFMTPTNYDREIIELAQRMDMDYRTTFCHTRELKQDVCDEYVKLIGEAEPECLVMSAIFWRHMTPALRKLILSRVSRGMGFVYIDPFHLDGPIKEAIALNPLPPEALTRGVPLKETGLLDAYGTPDQWIQCGQFGEGRIVFIRHKARLYKRGWNMGVDNFVPRRHPPFPKAFDQIVLRKDSLHYYAMRNSLPNDPFRAADDYSYAFLIRAMHWAAGLSKQVIRSVSSEPDRDRAAVEVALDGAGAKVRYRVRNRFGRVVATGSAGASFALRSLNAGLHFMDVLALDEQDRVTDFHAGTFESPGGDVTVSSFAPTSLFFAEDKAATFNATLTNRTKEKRSVSLRLSLVDVWGRIVARDEKNVDLQPGAQSITWQMARPEMEAAFAFKADLKVLNTGGHAACFVTLPDTGRAVDEFTSRFWGGPRNRSHAWLRMARQDSHRGGTGFQAFEAALCGLRTSVEHYIPLYQRKSKDAEGKLRAYNLDDPATRANTDLLLREKTKMLRPFGPHGYSLGHEASLSHVESSGHVVDYDFSGPTLAKFRKHLENVHGNVGALNRVWGTQFRSFREVIPSTYAEILPRRANLSPWMAHRRFMDRNFTDWLVYCAGKIREIDPNARVGITGIPGSGIGSFFGIDPYYIATKFDYLVQYSKKQAPLRMYLRYRQPGAVMGVFTGYDTTAPNRVYNETEAWRYLFMGCTEVSYFHFSGMGGGYYQPDMTVSTSGNWLGKSLREIGEGPSKLLFGKPRAHHGLAVYFSQNSVHATTALGIRVFTELNRQLESTVDNLERYGLSPAVISHHEVEAAPERLREFHMVFFPLCASLSSKEMKAITAFVEAGGTAVVDSLFGLYTEDGRYMPDQVCPWFQPTDRRYLGAFDALRGATSDGRALLATGERTVSVSTFRGIARRLRRGKPTADATFEKPESFVESRPVGKGRLIHSSCFLPNNDTAALLLRQRVVAAGVEPPMTVFDDSGALVAGIQMNHIQGDGKDYFGIVYGSWAGRFKTRPVLLKWRTKAHTYDVRTHRYLGEIDRYSIQLDPARAMLFCRLPQRIGTFSCDAKATTVSRGGSINVAIRQAREGEPRLLYRVWAETPQGPQPLAFARKVWIRGQGNVRIPVAYTDTGGAWRVHVREAITGEQQTLTVDVTD